MPLISNYDVFLLIADCDDPTPVSGNATIPSNTTYASYAAITCLEGYRLVGESLVFCKHGGVWSDYPTCVSIGKVTSVDSCFYCCRTSGFVRVCVNWKSKRDESGYTGTLLF